MKPGMQRDILVAFWFLFDEFELGNDCSPADPLAPGASLPPRTTTSPVQRSRPPKSDRAA